MSISKFGLLITGVAALLAAAVYFPLSNKLGDFDLMMVYIAGSMTYITSFFAYMIVFNGLEGNPKMFMSYIVMGMMLKMGLGIVAIFLVAFGYEENAIPFAVAYMLSYLVFTGVEVPFLMKKSRES